MEVLSNESNFNRIHRIFNKLESKETEKILNSSIPIIEDIMNTDKVVIYIVSSDNRYLRVKAHSKNIRFNLKNSIEIKEYSYIQKMINDKNIFVNHQKDKTFPVLIGPICYRRKVILVIAIYYDSSNSRPNYYENLFEITLDSMSDIMAKAYLYEDITRNRRYIEGSSVLNKEGFDKVLEYSKFRKIKYGIDFTLLKIINKSLDNKEDLYELDKNIRENDYVGLGKHDYLYLILSNLEEKEEIAINRLKEEGIETERVDIPQ